MFRCYMEEKKATKIERTVLGTFNGVTAAVVSYDIWGIEANALVLLFDRRVNTLSGETGYRPVRAVCNCYMPRELWDYIHFQKRSWGAYLKEVLNTISALYGITRKEISALSTGIDMRELAWATERYEDLWVQAWVTAGFKHNAMRIGVDTVGGVEKNSQFHPCGTINIMVVTNARLSLASMTSCFISITEAKTVAFQDLDIRSSFHPGLQATGTGTDQIVVASGNDFRCHYVGGHTKLGELTARSVTRACKEAINKQLAKNPSYHDYIRQHEDKNL